MTSPILVTGGTGTLGRHVVRHLRGAGREVRVLSRHGGEPEPGVQAVTADLVTGDGVDEAVRGVETIVHCAGNFKGDAAMTANLSRAASKAGAPYLVYISVVGTDRVPVVGLGRLAFAYFGAKREAERVVADSGLPWTILRATQFYDLFLTVSKALAKLPLAPIPAGFRFQPVDADEVAARTRRTRSRRARGLCAGLRRPPRLRDGRPLPELPSRHRTPPGRSARMAAGDVGPRGARRRQPRRASRPFAPGGHQDLGGVPGRANDHGGRHAVGGNIAGKYRYPFLNPSNAGYGRPRLHSGDLRVRASCIRS